MDIKITPKKLKGTLPCVDSKSHAHRLIIGAALSNHRVSSAFSNTTSGKNTNTTETYSEPCRVEITHPSEDITATQSVLSGIFKREKKLYCGESGSTLRFLLPLAGAVNTLFDHDLETVFYGEGKLPRRPIFPFDRELINHGCNINKSTTSNNEICTISGKLTGGKFCLPGDVSSQFITGLLMSLPLLRENSEIHITSELQSQSYVDLTIDVLTEFNIQIDKAPFEYRIPGRQSYVAPGKVLTPEADWSQGAFWLTANALGSEINLPGLNPQSIQGDKAIEDVIRSFAAPIAEASGKKSTGTYERALTFKNDIIKFSENTFTIDAGNIPDLVPIISVLGATTPGTTVITNASRLRIKESDRIKTTCEMIKSIGGIITEKVDGMIIQGKTALSGGRVDGAGDHRIVMSAAIAASVCEDCVIIKDAEAVNKSYPAFFDHYAELGGKVDML